MSLPLSDWLERLERRIVNRRDSTSVLVFLECILPLLVLLFGLQLFAASSDTLEHLYQAQWLWPSLWGQALLIGWLGGMGITAWQLRRDKRPMNWLVQLTVWPAGGGILTLAMLHGYKDTPLCMVMVIGFIMLRSLFPSRQLKGFLLSALALLVGSELALASQWQTYAPLIKEPIFQGTEMHWWWSLWCRAVFVCATVPMAGWIFFLAATLHRNRQVLENISRTDMLTGLVNRREFRDRLDKEAKRQARHHRPLSIVMFDLDHFKRINDTYGHPAGDKVLARFGQILRNLTRAPTDVAARFGGEEFVLMLPETDQAGARQVAEKIAIRLSREKFRVDGKSFNVTTSAGIAASVNGNTDEALKLADDLLYKAKQAGRNRIIDAADPAEEISLA
jgi:diguanylate cyclase (GGDEF)-like protein